MFEIKFFSPLYNRVKMRYNYNMEKASGLNGAHGLKNRTKTHFNIMIQYAIITVL